MRAWIVIVARFVVRPTVEWEALLTYRLQAFMGNGTLVCHHLLDVQVVNAFPLFALLCSVAQHSVVALLTRALPATLPAAVGPAFLPGAVRKTAQSVVALLSGCAVPAASTAVIRTAFLALALGLTARIGNADRVLSAAVGTALLELALAHSVQSAEHEFGALPARPSATVVSALKPIALGQAACVFPAALAVLAADRAARFK